MTTELPVHNYKDVEHQEWLIGHPHPDTSQYDTAEHPLRVQPRDDASGKVANGDAYEPAVEAANGLLPGQVVEFAFSLGVQPYELTIVQRALCPPTLPPHSEPEFIALVLRTYHESRTEVRH